uniref:Reverse transcriptase domain-containing protein n=1 Tax=Astyanax mexicanus TaxID=7994 RepID=A0A3B1J3P5_ASTMX
MKIFYKLYEILLVGFPVILCGDFNTITDLKDRVADNTIHITREGKLLEKICTTCGLKDSFRELFPLDSGFTRFDSRVKTRIDRIYTTKDIKVINYKTELLVESDHLAVNVKLSLGIREQRGYWKLNTQCLKNTSVVAEILQEIRRIKELKVLTPSNAKLWEVFKKQIKMFLIQKCKKLNCERNEHYNKLTAEYVELQSKRDKTIEDEENLFKLKSELFEINNETFLNLQLQAGMNNSFSGNTSNVIKRLNDRRENKMIKGIRDDHGNIIENEKEKRKIIKEKCQNAFGEIKIQDQKITQILSGCPTLQAEDLASICQPITKEEIIEVIKGLHDGKTPGPDGLPAELYKACVNEVINLLQNYFNEGLSEGKMNEDFYKSVITLIYKKGDQNELDNWRQISLLNIDYKILAKILMNRLNQHLEKIIEIEQTCAVKGRYMWDNLGMLRELILNNDDKDFYIVSLDQKKAFDFVSREYLWEALQHYGFPPNFIAMIKLLYKKSITQINVNGILTEPFETHRGVKQGCPLSAALYVLAISPLLNKIKNDTRIKGIKIFDKKSFKLTAFADDITVVIKNQKEFRILTEHFKTYEEVAGAKLNLDKTEGIWMGQNDPPSLDIEIKDSIKIIGLVVTKDNCAEINWTVKEQEVENELNQWKVANFKTRIQIVKTFVLSKILKGSSRPTSSRSSSSKSSSVDSSLLSTSSDIPRSITTAIRDRNNMEEKVNDFKTLSTKSKRKKKHPSGNGPVKKMMKD